MGVISSGGTVYWRWLCPFIKIARSSSSWRGTRRVSQSPLFWPIYLLTIHQGYEPSPTEPHDLSTSPSLILTPMSTPPQPSISIPSTINFSVAATPSVNQAVLNPQPFGNMPEPFTTHRTDAPADEPCLSDSFLFPPCDEATHYEHSPAPALEDTWINDSLNFTHQLHATDHPNDILVGPSSVDYLQDKIKELRIKNYQYREVVNSTLRSLQRLDTEFQMMQRATRLIPSMLRRMIRARTLLSEIESTLNNA